MVCCAAFGCNNRSSSQGKSTKPKEIVPKVTFHKFPKNSDRRKAWADAVQRIGWVPNGNSVLCSAHFTEDAFDRTSLSCVRLRDTAVPSIFASHNKQAPESTSAKESSEITPLENINTMDDVDVLPSTSTAPPDVPLPSSFLAVTLATVSPKTTISISTMTSCPPMSSAETLLRQKYKEMKVRYQKRIKLLQQSDRRHVRQIASLKNALATLKNKNVIHNEHSYMKKLPGTNAA